MLFSGIQQLYTYPFFFRFFSLICYYRCWVEFPVIYSRSLLIIYFIYSSVHMGLSCCLRSKESTCNAGATRDTGSIPALWTSPREGHGNPLQYTCLENPMGRGAWQLQSIGSKRDGHDWSDLAYTWCAYGGFLGDSVVKDLPADEGPWVGKIPWRGKWQPTPIFLPGKFHGERSLAIAHGVTKSRIWLTIIVYMLIQKLLAYASSFLSTLVIISLFLKSVNLERKRIINIWLIISKM